MVRSFSPFVAKSMAQHRADMESIILAKMAQAEARAVEAQNPIQRSRMFEAAGQLAEWRSRLMNRIR